MPGRAGSPSHGGARPCRVEHKGAMLTARPDQLRGSHPHSRRSRQVPRETAVSQTINERRTPNAAGLPLNADDPIVSTRSFHPAA